MAFQLGDVRGTKTAAEARHSNKDRPHNMLEKSQNASNSATRATWDRMHQPCECPTCCHFSDILGQCHPTTKHECEQEQRMLNDDIHEQIAQDADQPSY